MYKILGAKRALITLPAIAITATLVGASLISPSVAAAPAATTITVPNGVCKNYQAAQNLWRKAGLVVSPAKDGTGAHRIPIIDSNWVVLAQSPKAGVKAKRGAHITATVKKYTDSKLPACALVTVPNGVKLNYQAAQDKWRAAGLVVLPAIDATGAHRLPIIDSNWVVLKQNLKPGKKVKWGTGITATVKKYTDS